MNKYPLTIVRNKSGNIVDVKIPDDFPIEDYSLEDLFELIEVQLSGKRDPISLEQLRKMMTRH